MLHQLLVDEEQAYGQCRREAKNWFLNQIVHCCYSQVQPWVGLPFASVKVSRSLSLGSLINSNNIATGFDDAVFWLDFSIQRLLFQTEDLMDGKTTSRIIKHRFLHLQFSTVVKISQCLILSLVRLNFITLAKMDNKAETEIQVWHVIEFSKMWFFFSLGMRWCWKNLKTFVEVEHR